MYKIGDMIETGIDAGLLKGFIGKVLDENAGILKIEVRLTSEQALELAELHPENDKLILNIPEDKVHIYVERTSNYGVVF